MIDVSNSADIIDSRDVIARIEELRKGRKPWASGWNMPGCLPDCEPATFAEFSEAGESIAEELRRVADDADTVCNCDEHSWYGEHHASACALADTPMSYADDLRALADEFELADDDADGFSRKAPNGLYYWICKAESDGLDEDDADELRALESLADECEGYGDWEHGATLIRESHFEDYARELAEDLYGAAIRNASWPFDCIDWEQAAAALRHDYMTVDFDGVEYLLRA